MTEPKTPADRSQITPPFNDAGAAKVSAGVQRFRAMLEGTRANDLLLGRRLKQYELLKKLGSGAMGAVYEARNTDTGRKVAIKILDANFVQKHDALRRFEKEARLLAESTSPFITQLLDFSFDGEWHFIVTELVTGTTVAALLRDRGRLDEATAIKIASGVARAMSDLAALHIIHRDIKPDNILLGCSDDGEPDQFQVRLTDFGLARHTQQTQSLALTRASTLLGTPLYMSPEQFSDRKQLDARSDVYSLGVTLFTMLTGRPPFLSDDTLKLAELHRHETPVEVRSLRPELSDGVNHVVARCLQKRPDLRYATAFDLLEDLQRLQRGEATSIGLHPALPPCDVKNLQTYRFEWKLSASPADLWPFVSNTERLNRAIGLPAIQYTTTVGLDGNVQRFANVRIAGMTMTWREHAFEWIEQRRMGVLREFKRGPLKWFSSVVEFFPTVDGQTRLVHSLQVEGRGWLGRQFARYKMGVETRSALSKVYLRIDRVLSETRGANPLRDAFESEHILNRRQQQRLDGMLMSPQWEDVDRRTLLHIADFVRVASPQELGHLRPRELSQRLNLSFERVIAVLLRGAVIGLFELSWDVICPACRVAAKNYDLMRMVRDHEFCPACNQEFVVDLLDSVELIFRIHPNVRCSDTGTYCIGGPAHSPHVVAQTRLKPHETLDLGLALAPGIYCIRGPQLAFSLTFTVAAEQSIPSSADNVCGTHNDHSVDRLHLRLDETHDWRQQPILQSGQQLLTVVNGFDKDVLLRVERMAPNTNVLSAAASLGLPLFRELFPEQTPDQGQLASVTTFTLLQTEAIPTPELSRQLSDSVISHSLHSHLQQLAQHCSQHGGTWIKIVGRGAVMAFLNSEEALRCARSLHQSIMQRNGQPAWDIRCAINSGAMTITVIHGHQDYLGPAVELLPRLLQSAERGEIAIGTCVELDSQKSAVSPHMPKVRTICAGEGIAMKLPDSQSDTN